MGKINTSIIRNGIEYKVESIDEFEEQLDSSSTAGLSDEHLTQTISSSRFAKRVRSWNRTNTELFVNECLKHKTDFRNPKMRRRQIFTDIRLRLMEKGFNINEDSLDRKFRNLKIRYNCVKQNKRRSKYITWPYFEQMDNIFSTENKHLRQFSPSKAVAPLPRIFSRKPIVKNILPSIATSSFDKKEDTPPPPEPPVVNQTPTSDALDNVRYRLLALEERRTIAMETIAAELIEANRLTRLKIDLKNGKSY